MNQTWTKKIIGPFQCYRFYLKQLKKLGKSQMFIRPSLCLFNQWKDSYHIKLSSIDANCKQTENQIIQNKKLNKANLYTNHSPLFSKYH